MHASILSRVTWPTCEGPIVVSLLALVAVSMAATGSLDVGENASLRPDAHSVALTLGNAVLHHACSGVSITVTADATVRSIGTRNA